NIEPLLADHYPALRARSFLFHFIRLSIHQEREYAVFACRNIHRYFAAIQPASPCRLFAPEFYLIGLLRDGDLEDHSLRIPSLRAVRFQAESGLLPALARSPFCPFFLGTAAANSAAATAAISWSPLPARAASGLAASRRSRKPVSMRAAAKSACSRIRRNSGKLLLMP